MAGHIVPPMVTVQFDSTVAVQLVGFKHQVKTAVPPAQQQIAGHAGARGRDWGGACTASPRLASTGRVRHKTIELLLFSRRQPCGSGFNEVSP